MTSSSLVRWALGHPSRWASGSRKTNTPLLSSTLVTLSYLDHKVARPSPTIRATNPASVQQAHRITTSYLESAAKKQHPYIELAPRDRKHAS